MGEPSTPRRIAIVAGSYASVSPIEVLGSARGIAEVLFLLSRVEADAHPRLAALIAELGEALVFEEDDIAGTVDALRARDINTVVTFVDKYCSLVDRLSDGLNATRVIEGRWRKDVQRGTLRAAGLSDIDFQVLDRPEDLGSFAARIGLPIIVKPTVGTASQNISVLQNARDVAECGRELWPAEQDGYAYMAERFVTASHPSARPYMADYVSAEMFLVSGAETGFVIDRLPIASGCRESGAYAPSLLGEADQRSVLSAAGQACRALGLERGAYHTELKLSAPKREIIEVNGRLGGFIRRIVHYGTGVDVGRWAVGCALGESLFQELVWSRCMAVVAFQAPAEAVVVTAAPSKREVAVLPGVVAVDHITKVGGALNSRIGGPLGAAAVVWVGAEDHEALGNALAGLAEKLTRHFRFAGSAGACPMDTAWLERFVAWQPCTGPIPTEL